MYPEGHGVRAVTENENIALGYFRGCQARQAVFNQASGETVPPMRSCDCEVMQIPTPAVMAAQNSANYFANRCLGDSTKTGISLEKGSDPFNAIRFAEAHTFALSPQGDDLRVVANIHCSNDAFDNRHSGSAAPRCLTKTRQPN